MLVNVVMAAIDLGETVNMVQLASLAFSTGGLIGGYVLFTLATIMLIWTLTDIENTLQLWYAYTDGDEAAGDALVYKAGISLAVTGALKVGTALAKSAVSSNVAKYINNLLGDGIGDKLIKNADNPSKLLKSIKAMEKNGTSQAFIKTVVTTLPEESIIRIGKLTKQNVPQEFIEKLVNNPKALNNVSDFTILIFKESAKSYDDIVTLMERHGDELQSLYLLHKDSIVDVVLKYGDDAIAGINCHGEDFVYYYFCYGDEFAEDYLKYQDEAVEAYKQYGDEASEVLNGNKTDDGSGSSDLPSKTEPTLPEGGRYSNLDEGLNFTKRAAEHMEESARYVPVQTLQDAIRYGEALPDPQGSDALMYYITMYKGIQMYNLEVLYDKLTNTVYHFKYTRDAIGNLPAIK